MEQERSKRFSCGAPSATKSSLARSARASPTLDSALASPLLLLCSAPLSSPFDSSSSRARSSPSLQRLFLVSPLSATSYLLSEERFNVSDNRDLSTPSTQIPFVSSSVFRNTCLSEPAQCFENARTSEQPHSSPPASDKQQSHDYRNRKWIDCFV